MRIKRIMIMLLILILAIVLAACGQESLAEQNLPENDIIKEVTDTVNREVESNYQSGEIPEEIELIQDNYRAPSEHPGTLNRLTYHTWESFTYDEHSQELTKDAWVYLPYEYDPEQKYNVFYLSHGGWSNETTIMGTDTNPNSFKNVIDHAVEDVKMRPMILVMVTYNNTDGQDSFPHALELSKKGYNAFALIYRPGAQTACEDLARAIAFIHEHAEELQVDVSDYSLWGGSAGARMAAWLGSYGTESFGENTYPGPAAVIMQYTGLSEVYGNEPPTYNCVGTRDGIASYRTMQARIDAIKANGTDAEIEVFQGLSHGFGLGTGTVAEGWLDNAIVFWESNMKK